MSARAADVRSDIAPSGDARHWKPAAEGRRSDSLLTKKRVVHISLGTDVGGMEKLLVEFARHSDRERFDLGFVSLQPRGKLAGEIGKAGWPVFDFRKTSGVNPGLILMLARTLRRLRPQVVHTHNTSGFLYGVPAASLARVPRIIHTRHGQRIGATRRQTWLFRQLSKVVDRMVSVCEDGQRLTAAEGIVAERTCTIRNGVDLMRFPLVGAKADGRAVSVGRLSSEKNIDTLIRAVGIANDRIGPAGPALQLDIVGDGEEREPLEALSRELGLERLVYFHGLRSDIPAVLAGASMFVLPSLTEGISLTLLEAMASGLPVVASRVGGTPEVVADHTTGLLVPAGDPGAFAEAMLRIHQDHRLGERYGQRGRARVAQEFTVEKMVSAYQRLYDEDAEP